MHKEKNGNRNFVIIFGIFCQVNIVNNVCAMEIAAGMSIISHALKRYSKNFNYRVDAVNVACRL